MEEPELKLTLMEHLTELRARLWKVMLGVLALGFASLLWAREIFAFLMKPVLAALPEEGRALIYTSGIEEINVLLKVGLYAGIFLSTPLALYQLWQFVGPGLLKSERRLIGPFVTFGSLFFVGGALFCYFAILPSMFKFLLTPGESGAVRDRLVLARSRGEDATRFFFVGDLGRATELARAAEAALSGSGEGKIAAPPVMTGSEVELRDRIARMGRLLDLAIPRAHESEGRAQVSRAVGLHLEAEELLAKEKPDQAAVKLEEAATALAQCTPEAAGAFGELWAAHRHLAAASGKLGQEEWTRPMLSMKEQLSLVLMLEIAFGAIFELPLIMAVLAMVGILQFRTVAKYQRHALLGCVVAAAIVTPTGDAINLSLMAVPMMVCFELGLVLVWVFEKRRKERLAAEDPATTEPG